MKKWNWAVFFAKFPLSTVFTDGAQERPLTIKGPFRYLGRGREKLVLSAEIADLRTRVAVGIGIANEDDISLCQIGGLESFLRLEGTDLPTYPWYLEAVNGSICVMPDLSLNAEVVSHNTLNLSPATRSSMETYRPEIINQATQIAERAAALPNHLRIPGVT